MAKITHAKRMFERRSSLVFSGYYMTFSQRLVFDTSIHAKANQATRTITFANIQKENLGPKQYFVFLEIFKILRYQYHDY